MDANLGSRALCAVAVSLFWALGGPAQAAPRPAPEVYQKPTAAPPARGTPAAPATKSVVVSAEPVSTVGQPLQSVAERTRGGSFHCHRLPDRRFVYRSTCHTDAH